jgi:NADH-quinone oxidoreductase subunit M
MPLLMWLFIVPFISSIIAFIFPLSGRNLKALAVAMSLIPLAILLAGQYSGWIGSNIEYAWFPALSIEFHLSVDALSLVFLYLTAIIIPISILSMRSDLLTAPHFFYGLVLFLEALLIGFFTARDLVLFAILWEAMLLPLYFIISLWGGPQRQAAALKFLIYMIAGSALMIAAILALYITAHANTGANTFNMDALAKISASAPMAAWVGAIFLIAFSVKTPLFPFHAWLPDAYCQAPTAGTILLAGLLSKAGVYGFLRIGMELFPWLMKEWSPIFLSLAIVGVFYGGFAAWMENDFKRLIAYASFSHINFVLVGIFAFTQTAVAGSILQALNHGITITALFLVSGWLENRLGTTAIGKVSGLAKFLPYLCWVTLFFVLSSVGLPGTNNFIGELMIFFGLFLHNPWLAAILTLSIILSVIYMLRWMQKVYFEEPSFYQNSWIDIQGKEIAIALPLIALILWIGIYPAPVLKTIEPAAKQMIAASMLKESQ